MGKKRFRIFPMLSLSVLLFMIACSGSTGASARFSHPYGITSVGTNLYVTDTDNHTIRKIVIATAEVTTFAGSAGSSGSTDGTGAAARFRYPYGITSVGTNLYVADHITIRKISIETGEVTTLAGTADSWGYTDGTGAAARFYGLRGITNDGTNLYVVDRGNNTIRKIVIATGEVSTLVGTAGSWGFTDGTGAAALFNSPEGITSDGTNLYVADTDNHTIRKIVIATAEVTTFAGLAGSPGSIDGTGAAARFDQPRGITNDGTNLYVADTDNHTIRKIVIATGEETTLAGPVGCFPLTPCHSGTNCPVCFGSTDGTGAAARFDKPRGITNDGTNLYVADTDNHTIRKIVIATGEVTTLAGLAGSSGSTDGMGAEALFIFPQGITNNGTNLYVVDSGNSAIRMVRM